MPQPRAPGAPPRPASANRSVAEYVGTVVAAWLVPGAGHWVLGWRVRGALVGASVLALFWLGQALAIPAPSPGYPRTPMAVCRQVSPIFFACQAGNGLSALVSNALWGEPRYADRPSAPLDRRLPERLGLAVLLTSVSGLLNYILLLHIMDPRTWREPPEDLTKDEPEPAPDAAPGGSSAQESKP